MTLDARCSRCTWSRTAEPTFDDVIRVAVELDTHLFADHDVTFSSASEESNAWLARASGDLAKTEGDGKP